MKHLPARQQHQDRTLVHRRAASQASSPAASAVHPILQLQRQIGNRAVTNLIQRARSAPLEDDLADGSQRDRGVGAALPSDIRGMMEGGFGADFSQARAHTDTDAIGMNRDMGAQAYTRGHDIPLGGGSGQGLMAHELTHAVQQQQGTTDRDRRL